MSRRLSTAELELAEYHALGVKPDPADQTMARFERYERAQIIAEHEAVVAGLKAHASELGDTIRSQRLESDGVIRKQRRTIDRLYLAFGAAVMILAYFAVRDLGCKL